MIVNNVTCVPFPCCSVNILFHLPLRRTWPHGCKLPAGLLVENPIFLIFNALQLVQTPNRLKFLISPCHIFLFYMKILFAYGRGGGRCVWLSSAITRAAEKSRNPDSGSLRARNFPDLHRKRRINKINARVSRWHERTTLGRRKGVSMNNATATFR